MKKKQTTEELLQEILKRLEALEKSSSGPAPHYQPFTPTIPQFPVFPPWHNPNLHWHGAHPCYNNPCVFC